ncbi:MAG: ATP-binding cassette domain-containing protein [bacterium]|nr:ATP-binding cassette domain-containing protein [bacterium]
MQSPPRAAPLLQVRNLSAGYGHVRVLFGVSFSLAQSETLALLGANGAGKTTLLRTLGGLLMPTDGSVLLEAKDITLAEPEARFRAGMVQLRGGEGTFAELSVDENLRAALIGAGLRRAEVLERREEVLAVFPALAARLADPARDLSGGQRQMLALAMVLQHRPELLLIDELSLGLAPIVVQELLGALAQLREQGRTMLVVEQSVSLALDLADRAMFLENGRVVFEGRSEELRKRDDLLRAAFLGGSEGPSAAATQGTVAP